MLIRNYWFIRLHRYLNSWKSNASVCLLLCVGVRSVSVNCLTMYIFRDVTFAPYWFRSAVKGPNLWLLINLLFFLINSRLFRIFIHLRLAFDIVCFAGAFFHRDSDAIKSWNAVWTTDLSIKQIYHTVFGMVLGRPFCL